MYLFTGESAFPMLIRSFFLAMLVLHLFKKYIVDSQLFVALMGACLGAFFLMAKGIALWPHALIFFLFYWSGYCYTKYQDYFWRSPRVIFACVLAAVAIAMLLIFRQDKEIFKWLLICGLGFLYNSIFLNKTARQIPLLKIVHVAVVWGLINAWMAASHFLPGVFLITLLFICGLILPFDIRDVEEDSITTFPKLIGTKFTKLLAVVLLSASALLSFHYLSYSYAFSFSIAPAVAIALTLPARKTFPALYFTCLIEACSGLPLLCYLILR